MICSFKSIRLIVKFLWGRQSKYLSSSKTLTIIQQPTIGLVPHLSSFTIFSECFWVLYVSTSCLPRMFSSIDSSKRESVCGKAWWYGRDVPKIEVSFCSQRLKYYYIAEGQQPLAKIIEGHCKFFVAIMSVSLVCRWYLAPSIHPSENQCVAKHGGMVEMYQRLKYYYRAEGQQPSVKIIKGHCKFFVVIMSVRLVCRGCLALSIHPTENQCVEKHLGMVEIYQSLKIIS